MFIWLILAFVFAALEALAVWKSLDRLEYFAKPTVMICLFLWLYQSTGLRGTAFWFGLGIVFSLAGDVLLMISLDRMFLIGLIAFLLAHISYIIGFKDQFISITGGSLLLIVILVLSGTGLVRRIVGAMRARGESGLAVPVIVYSVVISMMSFAAMSTLLDLAWKTSAALLVSVGAFLFYISDVILAWNQFVSSIKNGRVLNIIAYHLGQIALIMGVVFQSSVSR